jgi:RecA/RadA recombinase
VQLSFVEKAKKMLKNNEGFFRTGCTLLDLSIGGGEGLGFPQGRIINFVGDKSSGKTFCANEVLAKNYHDMNGKFKWNYDDCEDGYTFNSKHLYNFEIMDEDTLKSETIENLDVNINRFLKKLKKDDCGVYIIDSLDGLSNEELNERSEERFKNAEKGREKKEKGTYGMKTPKFLSQEFFRTKAGEVWKKKGALVFISQVRSNIDPFSFKKYTRSGGKALDHFCHSVLWLANLQKIKKVVKGETKIVGLVVKAKLDKSKTPRPFRECSFSLYFDYGIDNIGSNLDYLFNLRSEKGELLSASKSIQWSGKEKNLKNLKEFLEKNEWYELAKKEKKDETGKANLSVEWLCEWLDKQEVRKKKTEEHFGDSYSRDALIKMIEENPKMEKELEIRTIAKWEEMEDAIKSDRRSKY